MKEKYLSLMQNICAGRIFLNTFGFILENVNDVNEFSILKIYDKNMNEVGKLYFNNGKVIINTKYEDCILDANYDISKMYGFIDEESNTFKLVIGSFMKPGVKAFIEWKTSIDFKITSNDNTYSGNFFINNSMDTEFGIDCTCHVLMNCEIPEIKEMTLKVMEDGEVFGVNMRYDDIKEKIAIMPSDWLNGFIRHDIKKGEWNNEISSYPYRMYAGIFNGAEVGENKDKLHVFLKENKNENTITYHNEMIPKISVEENSVESIIQKGLLMKKLDPKMFDKIKLLKELLLIGDISILDNLFSVCYDSYSDEELEALLGIKRNKMIYQNGADNLIESYFGIGTESQFLSIEQQKKLLKK